MTITETARISVAMCTYNGEQYLQEQLQSIAKQTRLPCELVVCDDGSKDSTPEILEAFRSSVNFPVRIHSNTQRLGPTANFNQAMRLCQGGYISLADQDDRWHPEKLRRLANVLDRDHEADMVFSDESLIDARGKPAAGSLWKRLRFTPRLRARFARDPGSVLLQRDVVSGHTMLFRRSLLERFDAIPERWPHDGWLTWISILWSQCRFLPEPLACYRLHGEQSIGMGHNELARAYQGSARFRHEKVARQFADLLDYLEGTPPEVASVWRPRLEKKVAFLMARAHAPAGQFERAIFILQHARSYFQLARGWRSMYRDCMLGPTTAG